MSVILYFVVSLIVSGYALPVDPRADRRGGKIPEVLNNLPNFDRGGKLGRPPMPDTPGLDQEEYNRYWAQMAKEHPALQEHLRQMKPEELAQMHPRMSEKVARDAQDIRNRLEEARRMNMDELRELQRLQNAGMDRRFAPDSEWIDRQRAMRDHLPQNYNQEDIHMRIEEQRRVLEEIDRKRREDYEHFQMQQEHQRRERLKSMNEQQRLQEEQIMRERREQMKHHERMNKPASKQQFEEVWEEDDGLKDEKFDPKTFFFLHDTNGDKTLDPMELQALFYNEVRKAYGNNADNMQTQEELARMREYALKEMDRNRDGMIALEEFLAYAQGEKFDDNEEWKAVADEEEAFTEEEMQKFEDEYYDDYYDYEYDEEGNIVGFKTKPPQEQTPVAQQQPETAGGDDGKHMKGDPDISQTIPSQPSQEEGLRGEQDVVNQHDEGLPAEQVVVDQHHDEGVPAEQRQQQEEEGNDEGMPGQEQQLHIQPAGVQREGQGQEFHKNGGETV